MSPEMLLLAIGLPIAGLAIGLAALLRGERAGPERVAEWRKAADTLGMEVLALEGAAPFPRRLVGVIDGTRVTVSDESSSTGRAGTAVLVEPATMIAAIEARPADRSVLLALGGLADRPTTSISFRAQPTGDDELDVEVACSGDPDLLATVLDVQTRRRLRWFVGQGGTVASGLLSMVFPRALDRAEDLTTVLSEVLVLAGRLRVPDDAEARLTMAARDAQAGVRLSALAALARRHSDSAATRAALRAALADPDLRVRLFAASTLGDEGVPVLAELARTDDDEIAVAALAALGPRLTAEQAIAALDAAVATGQSARLVAACAALGRAAGPASCARLSELATSHRLSLALAAIDGLALTADAAAQPRLLALLGHEDAAARAAAARAIAACGTIDAVAPLRAAIAAHPFDRGLRREALAAIAAIQARVAGAAPGQLSLAGAEQGALSLSGDDQAGALSDPDEPPA